MTKAANFVLKTAKLSGEMANFVINMARASGEMARVDVTALTTLAISPAATTHSRDQV